MSPFEYAFFAIGLLSTAVTLIVIVGCVIAGCTPEKKVAAPVVPPAAGVQADFDAEFNRIKDLRAQRMIAVQTVVDLLATNLPSFHVWQVVWDGNLVNIKLLDQQHTMLTFSAIFVTDGPVMTPAAYQSVIRAIAAYKLEHPEVVGTPAA